MCFAKHCFILYISNLSYSTLIFYINIKKVDTRSTPFNFDLDYKSLYTTFTELDSKSMDVYVNGEFYDFYPEQNSVIYMNMLVEEMHRLHVNYYKNFKQNAFMYENLD